MTEPLRLILFDVDGTLVDSQASIVGCMITAFRAFDLPPPDHDAVLSIVGLSLPMAVARLAPSVDDDIRAGLVATYKDAFKSMRQRAGTDHAPLYPGAKQVLADLHSVPNYLLGVATGKSKRGLDALIAQHELGCFVTRQVADHHPSKPHPAMIETAVSETGVALEDTVMIGDTSFDIDMGRAAGVTTIAVSWGYHDAARLGADHLLSDFAALPDLLTEIWKDR